MENKESYTITIYTGDPSEGFGGTDANVHIILCGNKGETDKIELKKIKPSSEQ